ncbi:MAG TPA: tetratricopeptide repeat protein [Candidatus Obscuribacterales bacterium]
MPTIIDVKDADRALKAAEDSYGGKSLKLAPCLDRLGSSYHAQGDYPHAEACYKRAYNLYKLNNIEDGNLVTLLHKLGVLNRVQNKFAESRQYYLEAIRLAENLYGPNSLEVAEQNNYLAGLYYSCGMFDDAEEKLGASVELYQHLDGDHSVTIGLCLFALALIRRRAGDQEGAQRRFRHAKRLLIDVVWDLHQDIESGLVALAVRHFEEGNTDKAEILLRHYLVIGDKLWTYHPLITESYFELADHFYKTGDYKSAEICYTRVLGRQNAILPDTDQRVIETLKRLAIYHLQRKEEDKAIAYMKQALGITI